MSRYGYGRPEPKEGARRLVSSFRMLASHKHRYYVISDFVPLSICIIHNGMNINQERKNEYLHTINDNGKTLWQATVEFWWSLGGSNP